MERYERQWLVKRLAIGIPIALGVVGITGGISYELQESRGNRTALERTISPGLAKVYGKEVVVQCTDLPDNELGIILGETYFDHDTGDPLPLVRLDTAYVCEPIADYLTNPHTFESNGQLGQALVTVAHEEAHRNGVANESAANCSAFQSIVETARTVLGVDEFEAHSLARVTIEEARGKTPAKGYEPGPECRDGGKQDLNPNELGYFINVDPVG